MSAFDWRGINNLTQKMDQALKDYLSSNGAVNFQRFSHGVEEYKIRVLQTEDSLSVTVIVRNRLSTAVAAKKETQD